MASFVFEASPRPVRDCPALRFALWRIELNSQARRGACGSGHAREESMRWLAPAAPVFAGTPAPTETLLHQLVICYSMRPV
ncbi:protein of unknown function [Pseudomonas sp. JV551A1]|uniref:Uncharacterized protein n=1 Tax=Pseudomonas inefficax TaxID=2078786 RepID=A0AAQ1PA63_9PSED|nr:protein of unknown function [Pseudomonas sp. JV551A1]SPO62012.1 protein of unknown function [Pseudomonas inefficax]